MNSLRLWIVAFLAVVLAACGGDETGTTTTSAAPPTTTPSTTTAVAGESTTSTAVETTTTTTEPAPEGTVIEVSVDAAGTVTGGGRHSVPLGERVTLVVTGENADEVHVHGYDLLLDLEAGVPGELTFDAVIPGVFEIELEGAGVALVDLEVGG